MRRTVTDAAPAPPPSATTIPEIQPGIDEPTIVIDEAILERAAPRSVPPPLPTERATVEMPEHVTPAVERSTLRPAYGLPVSPISTPPTSIPPVSVTAMSDRPAARALGVASPIRPFVLGALAAVAILVGVTVLRSGDALRLSPSAATVRGGSEPLDTVPAATATSATTATAAAGGAIASATASTGTTPEPSPPVTGPFKAPTGGGAGSRPLPVLVHAATQAARPAPAAAGPAPTASAPQAAAAPSVAPSAVVPAPPSIDSLVDDRR